MKWLKLIFGILFLLFAFFQMNDPDPFGWIAIYLAAAIISILAFFEIYYLPFIGATLIAALLWMFGIVPEVWDWLQQGAPNIAGEMKAETPFIEFTREFFGLTMIASVMFWQYRIASKRSAKK